MKRRMITALSLVLILCVMTMTVHAIAVPDLNRLGSIHIQMTYLDEIVPGGSLTLYPVADVHVENGADYQFRYNEAYAGCPADLTALQDSQTAQTIADYTVQQGISGTKVQIDENGNIRFADLPLGLYLLVQEDPAEGYNPLNPFLVSVPGKEAGAFVYDVNAAPKLQLEPVPTEPTEPPTEPTEPTPPPPDIPQTGQMLWPVPVLAVAGLLLLSIGGYFCVTGRKKAYED